MNKATIIGNLTRAPELRKLQSGVSVCTFTVAVNRRRTQNSDQQETDYFRVSAWRQLGENCARYLDKGRKVCVIGPVSVSTYRAQDGTTRANLEITADDVEFLTPRNEAPEASNDLYGAKKETEAHEKEDAYIKAEREAIQHEKEYVQVDITADDLPF